MADKNPDWEKKMQKKTEKKESTTFKISYINTFLSLFTVYNSQLIECKIYTFVATFVHF
jgi:hypothetical protein